MERLICSNERTAQLDRKAADLYNEALKGGKGGREELRSSQRAFLKSRDSVCPRDPDPSACLEREYNARISQLESILAAPGPGGRPGLQAGPPGLMKFEGAGGAQTLEINCSETQCKATAQSARINEAGGAVSGCEFAGYSAAGDVDMAFGSGHQVHFRDNNGFLAVTLSQDQAVLEEIGPDYSILREEYCGGLGWFDFGDPLYRK
jgi:uncharacterized protein